MTPAEWQRESDIHPDMWRAFRRRWRSPVDGLVHLTVAVVGSKSVRDDTDWFFRDLGCGTMTADGQWPLSYEVTNGPTSESVEVDEDPSPINCFGCMEHE